MNTNTTRSGFAPSTLKGLIVRALTMTCVPLMLLFAASPSGAGPLSLGQSPLFLSTAVPPNIFFLDDDSGSMDWHMITTESSGSSTGVMILSAGTPPSSSAYSYVFPDSDNNYGSTSAFGRILPDEDDVFAAGTMPADNHGVWRGRYHGYNKLYYNPNITYTPWPGVDDAGNAFKDATKTGALAIPVNAVRRNPYRDASSTFDLTTNVTYTSNSVPRTDGTTVDVAVTLYPATYYTWTDTNSDGVVDAGDAHTRTEIRTSGTCSTGADCPSTFTRPATRTDCPLVPVLTGVPTCTAEQELNNFANWYMYYRRRQHVAKGAIGSVIAPKGSEVRMGHATLHNNSGSSNIQIALMNPSLTSGAKKSLLDAVYKTASNNGTPLRTKYRETGRYFNCVNSSIFGDTGSYTCPILPLASGGNCQQNFAVIMTDGYYNDSFSGVGNTDGDNNTAFDGRDFPAYADTRSDTLADIAMRYYESDLSALPNDVQIVSAGVDNARHQHLNTYTVAFGVTGTLSAGPTSPTSAFAWPDPALGDLQKIDDLRHAAYNGRGLFLSASDPTSLSTGLQNAIFDIGEKTGSASAVAVNSRSLSTSTRIFQGRFTSSEWSGNLSSLPIAVDTGAVGTENWNAKTRLISQDWDTGRAILTYRRPDVLGGCSAGSESPGGVAFRWTNLGAAQQCLLNDDPATTGLDDDTKGSLRVDFLRGDNTSSAVISANFRKRLGNFKLGDVVNSSPVFVGAPPFLPDLQVVPHAKFRTRFFGRTEMLYVGANDGMLHGFDATTGDEKIAYVPSMVYPNLNQLTNPSYVHRYYVDGSPTAGDVYGAFGATHCPSGDGTSTSGTDCWRTVLVGGLAGGGKGVYALDATDPTLFNESAANASKLVLWEFLDSATAAPDNDMGYIYGDMSIAKMANGKWAAIFGNGYNSVNENAVLYIVDIVDGSLIRKIQLNQYGGTGNSNGLSAPAVIDKDGDSIADYIYAGDLRGNMWKVDVRDSNPTNWGSGYKVGSGPSDVRPLFVATDASSNAQVISQRPQVSEHPTNQGGFMVYFGTGRYIAASDKTPASSPINHFYGIWDKNTTSGDTPVIRSALVAQSITPQTGVDINGDGDTTDPGEATLQARTVSTNPVDWTSKLGWALALRTDQTDSSGEMSVSNPILIGGALPRLIFTTLIPTNATCTFGGSSWLMDISPANGGALSQNINDFDNNNTVDTGIVISGVKQGDGILAEPVILRGGTGADGRGRTYTIAPDSSGGINVKKSLPPSGTNRRMSWRQLR